MTALTDAGLAVVLDVGIDEVTMDQAVELIDLMVHHGRLTGATHQVATVNVDFLVKASKDAHLRRVLQHADLCIADGMPVIWGARLTGQSLGVRVAGVDLVQRLVAESAERGWRIHFFGSKAPIAEQAAGILGAAHPEAMLTAESGPFLADVNELPPAVTDGIVEQRADILCVALGNPKQEFFIEANRAALGVPVLIGVGGTLDMIVGKRRRAPAWMQRSGLEWVFRALQEPWRLGRRYAYDAWVYLPRLARSAVRLRSWRRGWNLHDAGTGRLRAAEGATSLSAGGRTGPVTIELDGAPLLSTEAVAMVVAGVRRAAIGGDLVEVVGASEAVAEQLRRVGVEPRVDGRDQS